MKPVLILFGMIDERPGKPWKPKCEPPYQHSGGCMPPHDNALFECEGCGHRWGNAGARFE
jgi:hypothetical protein